MPKQLTPADIHGTDPLANLLFERLKLKSFTLILFFVFAGLVYGFALPLLWGYTPVTDGISLINILLVFPVAGYYYARQTGSVLRVYHSVTRFFREEIEGYEAPFEKLRKWHARPWQLAGALIGLLSAGFGTVNAQSDFGEFWYNANWFQLAFIQIVRFLAMYMIGMITARHIAASMALNGLFQHAQFPLTLDADRLEVFQTVKNFALEIVGIAAIIGLNLGLQPLIITPPMPEYAIYVGLYFILAPISFLLPLWQAHQRMLKIKNDMLEKLHRDFQEESQGFYEKILKDPKKDSSNLYLKKSETLASIKDAIEIVSKSPDWPFEGTTLYRLFVTVISPFILAIGDTLTNAVNGFLK